MPFTLRLVGLDLIFYSNNIHGIPVFVFGFYFGGGYGVGSLIAFLVALLAATLPPSTRLRYQANHLYPGSNDQAYISRLHDLFWLLLPLATLSLRLGPVVMYSQKTQDMPSPVDFLGTSGAPRIEPPSWLVPLSFLLSSTAQ